MNNYQMLIKSKGVPVTLTKTSAETYSTVTRKITRTTTSHVTFGYVFMGNDSSQENDNFTTASVKILLSPKQINNMTLPVPVAGDRIISDTETYEVINVSSANNKDEILFYTCDLRA